MRPRLVMRFALSLVLLALSLSTVATAYADSRLQRYVIAGGGGELSGGNFRLHGTIGQPAVAVLSGANFVLQGGFWYVEAVPTRMYPIYLPVLLRQ